MILTFGELLLRLQSYNNQRLFQSDRFETSFCGSEANVAVALNNYGLQSKFVSKVPNNPIGLAAISSLKPFNVDVSSIAFGGARLGLYYLEKGASQRASKVIYDRKHSAFAESLVDDYDWDELFKGVKWFHFSGINPALSENLFEISIQACKTAKSLNITISCDINYRATLWTKEEAQEKMTHLMKYVDVVMSNESDLRDVFGIRDEDSNIEKGQINKKGYYESTKLFAKKYNICYVAMTLRESFSASYNRWSGIIYDCQNDKHFSSVEYDIQVVDRVGAGDSFAAGIIYGLHLNHELQDTLDFAVASSCLKHSIEGDFNRVSIKEIETLLKGNLSGRINR